MDPSGIYEKCEEVRLEVYDKNPAARGAFSTGYPGTWGSTRVSVLRLDCFGSSDREAEILRKLDHENLLKCFATKQYLDGTFDIIVEVTSNLTLAGVLYQRRGLTTSWKSSTIHQISDGLAYLHARGLMHLGLDPLNITFRDQLFQQVVIADFGIARIVDSGIARTAAGEFAHQFRAPDPFLTQKSDAYSLAVIACCILYEKYPKKAEETNSIIIHQFALMESYPELRGLLAQAMQGNPDDRPTAEQLRNAFQRLPHLLEIANHPEGELGGVELEVYKEPIAMGVFSVEYAGTWGSRSVSVLRLACWEDRSHAREAKILLELNHDNILKCFTTKESPYGTFDIVVEKMSGLTLAAVLFQQRNFATSWKSSTIYQISDGLAYLHARGLMHLGLSPSTILFRDHHFQRVVIADFGIARMADSGIARTASGFYEFKAFDRILTQKSDVYSVAMIACCILFEQNPSSELGVLGIAEIVTRNPRSDYPNWLKALRMGRHPVHSKRLTAEELRDAFLQPPYSFEIENRTQRNDPTGMNFDCKACVQASIVIGFIVYAVYVFFFL